jgi:hypothetical protein
MQELKLLFSRKKWKEGVLQLTSFGFNIQFNLSLLTGSTYRRHTLLKEKRIEIEMRFT